MRFYGEERGFLFGRVSALYKGNGLFDFPAQKARCLHGICSPFGFPKSVKMSYDSKFVVFFIARIETIVTAIQNIDLIVNAPMVRLSNAPPPIM